MKETGTAFLSCSHIMLTVTDEAFPAAFFSSLFPLFQFLFHPPIILLQYPLTYRGVGFYCVSHVSVTIPQIEETHQNLVSSRSHTILTITVEHTLAADAEAEAEASFDSDEVLPSVACAQVTSGRLTLVDLAGSERLSNDERSAKQARQTGNINKSLGTYVLRFCLGFSRAFSFVAFALRAMVL